MKDENILNEGLEKSSEKKDNMNWISCLAFCKPIGCPPSLANLNFAVLLAYYRVTAFFMEPLKSARVQLTNWFLRNKCPF
jgi:hypothetical protein